MRGHTGPRYASTGNCLECAGTGKRTPLSNARDNLASSKRKLAFAAQYGKVWARIRLVVLADYAAFQAAAMDALRSETDPARTAALIEEMAQPLPAEMAPRVSTVDVEAARQAVVDGLLAQKRVRLTPRYEA